MSVVFSTPPRSAAAVRVLVIDDDEIALQAVSDVLESAGFDVRGMVSPIGATQVIASESIQVAVIDLNMPLLRGDRLISMIRNWDRIRDLPVVLISGAAFGALEQIGQQLPGVQLVYKDTMRSALPGAVQRALAGRSQRSAETSNTQRFSREEVGGSFLKSLPQHSQAALRLWTDLAQRRTKDTRALLVLLSTMRTQAQLCGFSAMSKLTNLIGDLAENDVPSSAPHVSAAVIATLTFFESLSHERGGLTAATARLTPHIERLEQLRARL